MAESTQSMPDACRAGASRSDASGRGPKDTGGEWSNKVDFFMAGISSTIGLGNLWRFPYQCYRNGGGEWTAAPPPPHHHHHHHHHPPPPPTQRERGGGGGSSLGPNVKKSLHRGLKGGGGSRSQHPPPLRFATDTYNLYAVFVYLFVLGRCPVKAHVPEIPCGLR